jgi:hypothetical protein
VGWLGKWLVVRWAGRKAYVKSVDFALGLILGQFVVGVVWSLIGMVLHVRTFSYIW